MNAAAFDLQQEQGNAFLIEGDDRYWVEFVLNQFVQSVPSDSRDFNLKLIKSFSTAVELSDAARACSLIPGEKTVVIASGYTAKDKSEAGGGGSDKEKAAWTELLGVLDDDAVLVLDNVKIPYPTIAKRFVAISAKRLEPQAIRELIPKMLGDVRIESRAANMLVDYCNRDMNRISLELTKLTAYTEGKPITADIVDLLVANTVENEVYEFSGALAEKNKAVAMRLLDRFLARGTAYAQLLGLLIGQYRRMLHAALSPKSDAEVAEFLNVKPYAILRARETARKYTKVKLKEMLDILVDAELKFKSGEMSDETAFKTAVSKLIAQ